MSDQPLMITCHQVNKLPSQYH